MIKKSNMQVYITLPRSVVKKVDEEAKKENRTRSSRLAKTIIDYYENEEGEN